MARNIQSLERAAAMLRLLAGGERRLGLSDIASSLGLAKGTAHGILRTLQQEGFVEQDDVSGRYQLGAELLRLGTTYLDVHELRARALVWTDDLARSSGESVHLGVLHQHGVLIVHHVFRPDDEQARSWRSGPCSRCTRRPWARCCRPSTRSRTARPWRPTASPSPTVRCPKPADFEHILDVTRAWVRGRRRGDLGGRRVHRRPHPRPAAHAGRRGRHHRGRGAAVPVGRGGCAAPRADRRGTGLCPRGVTGSRRRAVLTSQDPSPIHSKKDRNALGSVPVLVVPLTTKSAKTPNRHTRCPPDCRPHRSHDR